MTENDIRFLARLCNCDALSGKEKRLLPILESEILQTGKPDPMGNLIYRRGCGDRFLFTAHMDEVGFMITGIEENGTLRFSSVGGVDPKNLASKRVRIGEKKITGVIESIPVHFNQKKDSPSSFEDLCIRIGTQSKAESESLISLGDFAAFDTDFSCIQADGKACFMGKALDNRIGCYLLTRLLQSEAVKNGTFAFCVQEETGLRGAASIVNSNCYDYMIAIDTTTSNDLPKIEKIDCVTQLGMGPVISYADGGTVYEGDFISGLMEYLRRFGVKTQTKTQRTGGNEARVMQLSGHAKATVSISVPCRYIHGPLGVVFEDDIEETLKALQLICRYLDKEETTHDQR